MSPAERRQYSRGTFAGRSKIAITAGYIVISIGYPIISNIAACGHADLGMRPICHVLADEPMTKLDAWGSYLAGVLLPISLLWVLWTFRLQQVQMKEAAQIADRQLFAGQIDQYRNVLERLAVRIARQASNGMPERLASKDLAKDASFEGASDVLATVLFHAKEPGWRDAMLRSVDASRISEYEQIFQEFFGRAIETKTVISLAEGPKAIYDLALRLRQAMMG